jgi:TPR repeat protein
MKIIRSTALRILSVAFFMCAACSLAQAQSSLTSDQVQMIRGAAIQGNPEAMILMGNMYRAGRNGLKQNLSEALKWYKKAADQGNTEAMNTIGFMNLMGEGIQANYKLAMDWYRKAARAGDPYAIKILREYKEVW